MRFTRILAVAAAGTLATALGGIGVASAGDGLNKSGTQLEVDEIGYSKTVQHLSNTPPVGTFVGSTGSDLAFQGKYAFAGNYNGFVIYDISNPKRPKTVSQVHCPGSQNDITVSGNLLYLSTDSSRSDDSCSSTTQPASVKDSWEGIKIFDIKNKSAPRYLKAVETRAGRTPTPCSRARARTRATTTCTSRATRPARRSPTASRPTTSSRSSRCRRRTRRPPRSWRRPNLFPDGGNPGGTGPTGTATRRRRVPRHHRLPPRRTSLPAPAWVTASSWT